MSKIENAQAARQGHKGNVPQVVELAVESLLVGDKVDLESCPFLMGNQAAESEYGVVESVEHETNRCIVVSYENFNPVGYPAGTKLKVADPRCSFCDEPAVAVMPQSSDQGKTVDMVRCCAGHHEGWWDGADWDGRNLEVNLGADGKLPKVDLDQGADCTIMENGESLAVSSAIAGQLINRGLIYDQGDDPSAKLYHLVDGHSWAQIEAAIDQVEAGKLPEIKTVYCIERKAFGVGGVDWFFDAKDREASPGDGQDIWFDLDVPASASKDEITRLADAAMWEKSYQGNDPECRSVDRKLPELTEKSRQLASLVIEQAERNGFEVEADAIRDTVDQFCKMHGISATEAERVAACEEAERQWADKQAGEALKLQDMTENSKLSYVDLMAYGAMGKGIVGTAMLNLGTGGVFDLKAVGKSFPGELERATEIRQPSSGQVAAVKFEGDGRYQVVDLAQIKPFDGYDAEQKRQESLGPRNVPEARSLAENDPKRYLRELKAAFATIANHSEGNAAVKDFALEQFNAMPLALIDQMADAVAEEKRLRVALSEVHQCLDGLGAPISQESIETDYVTRARYFTQVALGGRDEFPEQDEAAQQPRPAGPSM